MRKNPTTILAINPGTRYIGLAAFSGLELLDWGIRATNGRWSTKKLEKVRRMMSKLIEEYRPNILVVKRHHPSRGSEGIDQITCKITNLAAERGIRVTWNTLADFTIPTSGDREAKIAEWVCYRYPALVRELVKEKAANNNYHTRMFEAVALGFLVAQKSRKLVPVEASPKPVDLSGDGTVKCWHCMGGYDLPSFS